MDSYLQLALQWHSIRITRITKQCHWCWANSLQRTNKSQLKKKVTEWFFRNISANPLALTSSRSQMTIINVNEIKWREARAGVRISINPCVYNINGVEWVCLSAHLSTHHSWARRKENYGLASKPCLRYFDTFLIISFLKKNLCLMHEHWALSSACLIVKYEPVWLSTFLQLQTGKAAEQFWLSLVDAKTFDSDITLTSQDWVCVVSGNRILHQNLWPSVVFSYPKDDITWLSIASLV